MAKKIKTEDTPQLSTDSLVEALTKAIQAAKPIEKKNAFNRKPKTPWSPKEGEVKLKLKRKLYQHGIGVDPDMLTNAQIALANKLRPGVYCDGWITVTRRKDKGIDFDYQVKTPTQRLKLVNLGITSLDSLFERLIAEAEAPKKSEFDLDSDE